MRREEPAAPVGDIQKRGEKEPAVLSKEQSITHHQ
jgi:hypothetical protein